MLFVYCTAVSLLSSTVPQHIVAFVPSGCQFKNYIVVEIGLLLSQQFMNSHFHCLIIRNQPLTKFHCSTHMNDVLLIVPTASAATY